MFEEKDGRSDRLFYSHKSKTLPSAEKIGSLRSLNSFILPDSHILWPLRLFFDLADASSKKGFADLSETASAGLFFDRFCGIICGRKFEQDAAKIHSIFTFQAPKGIAKFLTI